MRRVLFFLAGVAILLGVAGPAWAHVSWKPKEATTGGPAELRLRVPNERDDEATTAVELVFPAGHTLAGVSAPAVEGWTVTLEGDPVATITWKTTGAGLTGDEEVLLPVAIGTVYGAGGGEKLLFKALQTYSGGEVVRWIEEAPASGEEPEHPAPILTLTGEAAPLPGPSTTEVTDDPVITTPAPEDGDEASSAPLLVLLAVLVGATVMTGIVVVRRRRGGPRPPHRAGRHRLAGRGGR